MASRAFERNPTTKTEPDRLAGSSLKDAARSSLSQSAGHALTDSEWARSSAKLLEYVKTLRTWDHSTRNEPTQAGNVVLIQEGSEGGGVTELPCQREL
jgi:hypothetical protein